jgi:hypothetical protein
MYPESKDLTTFWSRYGLYKYKVMPFGLTNGPATFQCFVNDTFMDYLMILFILNVHLYCGNYADIWVRIPDLRISKMFRAYEKILPRQKQLNFLFGDKLRRMQVFLAPAFGSYPIPPFSLSVPGPWNSRFWFCLIMF